jgi:UDP-4-amino-4-deoxy-L-arabinose-oxoglutarate aminotransferase
MWRHDRIGENFFSLCGAPYRRPRTERSRPLSDPAYPMKHPWHLFIVRLDTDKAGMSRDEFMEELKRRNIGTGLHFRAVHLQKYYTESLRTHRGMLPNTEWNSDRICSLPLFPEMTAEDVDVVVEAIKEILSP